MSTTNSNRNNSSARSTNKPAAAEKLPGLSFIGKVADKAKFLNDATVVALGAYIKARHGGDAWQPAADKDVVFNVQFKDKEGGEVKRKVVFVAVFANGEYYTRFKAIVTTNGTKRTYFPVALDDAIGILQDTANGGHYSNRISAVSVVEEAEESAA